MNKNWKLVINSCLILPRELGQTWNSTLLRFGPAQRKRNFLGGFSAGSIKPERTISQKVNFGTKDIFVSGKSEITKPTRDVQ